MGRPFTPGPRIYNLFPRLVGGMEGWMQHFGRIKAMGFDWVYVNPFHFPGYSGSLYAVKDYYRYHPLFVDDNRPLSHEAQFQEVLDACHAHGLKFMMDLVLNHTAFDSVLATEHPEYFLQNPDGTLRHPGCQDGEAWVEWGDLAQLDNAAAADRDGLWRYWLGLMRHYLAMGVDGFRCDAAYHVPSELWRFLIPAIKHEYPRCEFFGETLGCRPWEVVEVADCGFDYVFNSVCWWNYVEPWFLETHPRTLGAAPSIGFPESHDTARAAEACGGNELALKQKYAFAALFSTGVLMPLGYEFGYTRRLDVVTTMPGDAEAPTCDLSDFVARINALKISARVFNVDGPLWPVATGNEHIVAYAKATPDSREKALFLLNLDMENWQELHLKSIADAAGTRFLRDVSPETRWERIEEDMVGKLAPGCCQILLGSLVEPPGASPDGQLPLGHAQAAIPRA